MIKGLPEFFKWYDVRFFPQNTILTLDYPILADLRSMSGIDAVWEYVKCIALEQDFLLKFDESYVREILYQYHGEYTKLVENICSIVLPNVIGHLLLKKPLSKKGISDEELQRLGVGLESQEKVQNLVENVIARMVDQLYNGNQELKKYFNQEAGNLAVRMVHVREQQCMRTLFFCRRIDHMVRQEAGNV